MNNVAYVRKSIITLIERDLRDTATHKIISGKIPKVFNMSNAYGIVRINDEGDSSEETLKLSDYGKAEDEMYSISNADTMLVKLLTSMDDREKLIFSFLLLKEAGYNLTHQDGARILSLSREHYTFLVKNVRLKAGKLLQEKSL